MKQQTPWWAYLLPLPAVWWAALLAAPVWQPGKNLLYQLGSISAAFDRPMAITWCNQSPRILLLATLGYGMAIVVAASDRKNRRRGEEHGSARWGNVKAIAKFYRDPAPAQNLLLTRNFRIGLDGHKHKRNLNVLVVGGSGAGKTRTYAIPNVMQCNCSMVITDPKSGATRS